MNQAAVIRLAPVMTADEYADRDRDRRDMYYHGSFRLLRPETPLIVDHNADRQVGVVREFDYRPDPAGGTWVYAYCRISDDAPSWLKKGTPCSFGYVPFSKRSMGTWEVIWELGVDEVSVLSPGVKPYETRAKVEWVGTPGHSGTVDRQLHPGRVRRPASGEILGVR